MRRRTTSQRRRMDGATALAAVLLAPSLWAQTEAAPVEVPAIVALTLDTSGSVSRALLEQTRDLALGVLESLPPSSQVALFTFDDESRLILERSSDASQVQGALDGVARAGRYTALHDALYDASRYLENAPRSRKAIVLVTDGKDENSALKLEDGLEIAARTKIPVFAIGVGRVQERVLRRIAKLTEGDYLPIELATGIEIAERVRELELPAELATVAAPPVATTTPLEATRGSSTPMLWLGLVVGGLGLLAALAVAAMWLRSRQPPAQRPERNDDDDEPGDSTLVMRAPSGTDGVDKTLFMPLKPSLRIIEGAGTGQVFNLSMDTSISLGRAPTNGIVVSEAAVSGQHCRVRPESGGFVLLDLKSTNGTYVNDRRVSRHALKSGDVIKLGSVSLQFRTT